MTDQEHPDPDSHESWSEEIHRRGLWQVTIAYLAGGWAIIEAVDILVGQGILSATAFRGALLVLAVGFPVVLGTAYVQSTPARKIPNLDEGDSDGVDAGFIPARSPGSSPGATRPSAASAPSPSSACSPPVPPSSEPRAWRGAASRRSSPTGSPFSRSASAARWSSPTSAKASSIS